MKGIFLTDASIDTVYRVYGADIRRKLEHEIELFPDIIGRGAMHDKREILRETNVIFSTWGMPYCEEEEIKACFPVLKAVFYAAGSVQSFAREFLNCGIKVFSAWAANAIPVAEYTVAQIILANKGFFQSARKMKPEMYFNARQHAESFPGNIGIKVGLIGCGMIGSLVSQKLREYHVDVNVYDPFLPDSRANELGVKKCSLIEVFSECQTISNHLPDNASTKDMLNYRLFSIMKENAVLINTGRGAQVVEDDLIQALRECPERTAVLDVTYPEPPVASSGLFALDNVILTPHIAGSMSNELARIGEYAYNEFISFKNGSPLQYEVTAKMLDTMA